MSSPRHQNSKSSWVARPRNVSCHFQQTLTVINILQPSNLMNFEFASKFKKLLSGLSAKTVGCSVKFLAVLRFWVWGVLLQPSAQQIFQQGSLQQAQVKKPLLSWAAWLLATHEANSEVSRGELLRADCMSHTAHDPENVLLGLPFDASVGAFQTKNWRGIFGIHSVLNLRDSAKLHLVLVKG